MQRVQRGGLVQHSEGGKIEAGVDKEIRGSIAHHGSQADMHHLGGEFPHNMNPEQPEIVPTKEQLQKAILVADDSASCIVPIPCPAGYVSDPFFLERLFCFSDHADFRNGIDAIR